jgi:DNA-binding transcriptional LysR family regulator
MSPQPAPKLAHLRSFLYVSRLRSISKAAADLGVSQPTVTEHIQRLEEGYGRLLFTRGPNGVELTLAGEALKRTIQPSLEQLDRLRFAETPMEGHIGLGGPPDLLSMRVLPALKPLYDANVYIRIRPGTAEQLLKQLEDHTLDMFIATREIPSETTPVTYEPLFEEEYVLVGTREWHDRIQGALEPGDSRAEVELKTVEALAGAPFLAFDATLTVIRDHPLVSKHRNAIFTEDKLKQVPLIMPDFRALREVAITGSGVTVIPRYIVQDALREERLFELYVPENRRYNQLFIAFRDEPRSEVASQLIATLQTSAPSWEEHASVVA